MAGCIHVHTSSPSAHGSLRSRDCRWQLTILLLVCCLQPLAAQEKLLPVLHFTKLSSIGYNVRSRVARDHEGFVWVGANYALQRFDGYTTRDYRNIPGDPRSLSTGYVSSLLVDRGGHLWVGTFDAGLSLYDRTTDSFFNLLPRAADTTWYNAKCITRILEDRKGTIWLASRYSGVVRLELPPARAANSPDSLLRDVRFTTFPLGTPRNTANDLVELSDGRILIGSDNGLLVLNPASASVSHLADRSPAGLVLDTAEVSCLCRGSGGSVWIGTKTSGLVELDSTYTCASRFTHRKGDPLTLASDNIIDIAEGNSRDLWISTDAGLDLFSPAARHCIRFLMARPAPRWPAWMMALSVDDSGILWVAANEGVYCLTTKSRTFSSYGLPANNGRYPILFETNERDARGHHWFSSGGKIYRVDLRSLTVEKMIDVFRGKKPTFDDLGTFIDRHGSYWYGTWGLGLFRVDLETGQVWNYAAGSGLGRDLTVNSIVQGPRDTLFVAARFDGLMKFDPQSARFLHLPGFPKCEAWTVHGDSHGRVWMTSSTNGIYLLDAAQNSFTWLHHDPADPRTLASDHARRVIEDSKGRIWIGAGNVVHLWDAETGLVTRYPNPGFSKSPFAAPIGADGSGRIWIDYLYGGLAALDPASGTYVNFDAKDGLSDNFNEMDTLGGGRLLVTTSEGLTIFHPDSIQRQRRAPPFIITRVSVNDESVPRPALLDHPQSFVLPYSKNVIEFEFAAIDIDAPDLVEYRYKLEGLEKDWVKPGDRRYVRYTSLSPGDYTFRVRASSFRGEWPNQEIALAISIAPPWWRTWWAYGAYGIMIMAALSTGYRLRLKQVRLKQQAAMEHFQVEHLAEVDRLKSRFFTNISHEFRTPLTLILGPAAQAIEETEEPSTRHKLHLIRENASKLLSLVNHLLDFSRVESGMMRLKVSTADIVCFLRRTVMEFESWAERKKIRLSFHSNTDSAECFFDPDKLEKIVNNLMSNALKFTPQAGTVEVNVTYGEGTGQAGKSSVILTVRDNGIGIAPRHLPRIFERFYRVDETHTTEGTGIGLALTKELVDLHHGTIALESAAGKGTAVTIVIPVERAAFEDTEIAGEEPGYEKPEKEPGPPPLREVGKTDATTSVGKSSVLIVEDNSDLRIYLREVLESSYEVHEASTGKVAYERAIDVVPDIVISDIMMPEMDGVELCRALKQDVRTSHIPVILLTARADVATRIEGLGTGADDYVTKPFDTKELAARVRNLIEQRRRLREMFSASVPLKPGEVAVNSLDDALLKKVIGAVERNMGNEDFGVDDLAREACLSRTHLNRKLHALTNLSPAEFVRHLRLQRARELLEKNAGSVAEVAFQVGFGNLSHFSASFRERFGVLPSEIRRGTAL